MPNDAKLGLAVGVGPVIAFAVVHYRTESTAITVDYGELADANWFERDWLLSHVDDDSFRLPRRDSIARRLLEDWLGGEAG